MTILGIETSCDETSAGIITGTNTKNPVQLLSNVVSSSLSFHAKTGGIIPEIAAREQIKYIIPVIDEALKKGMGWDFSKKTPLPIDAIAVTIGPGLIGSLLVGVETAKTLSFIYNKPLFPVNHLFGHIYANFINNDSSINKDIKFPAIALLVSGAHTDLVILESHGKIKWIGGSRDDAAGEAFDKIGRLLHLPYPAGPRISELAKKGNPNAYKFPRPMISSKDYDFSFSGLKTAAFNEIKKHPHLTDSEKSDLCASIQQAIIDVLIKKTINAITEYKVKSVLLGGGVTANQKLREELQTNIHRINKDIAFCVPPPNLCTDNGAMIATAGFYLQKQTDWQDITANPELYFD